MDITKYKSIVILSGAGVSTNAGIPDYRSSTGIFAQLVCSNKYPDITHPVDFFSRQFVNSHPEIKDDPHIKKFRQQMFDAQPTASHQLAKWLYDKGILCRVITQNVDGLYQKTGLPSESIIEFHGNYCKDTIVLYGDAISNETIQQVLIDMAAADLLIVMGTSLQVAPFCAIPNLARKDCVRVLVDLYPDGAKTNRWVKPIKRYEPSGLFEGGGLYADPIEQSFCKFGKRKVTLRPLWNNHKRFPKQYIFKDDTDEWAKSVMNKLF